MRYNYLILAALALGAAGANEASAEILSLDCSRSEAIHVNAWVDMQQSTVTMRNSQWAASPDLALLNVPAKISTISISWSFNTAPGNLGGVQYLYTIDRTTGILSETHSNPYASGSNTYQCTKVSEPPPATKF